MGDAGTMSVLAQDTLTGAGIQTITGAKTFNDQKLLFRNPANTFTLTTKNPAISANYDYLMGRIPYTFFVLIDGGLFKVVDCATGGVVSSGSSAATAIQYAITNIPALGGSIFINAGDYDLGSTGLTLTLASSKPVDIGGCGPATRIRTTAGTGYLFTTGGTATSHNYLKIHDILFQGGTTVITSGRSGINLAHQGPNAYLENVWLKYFDIALFISDANSVSTKGLKIQVANTGVKSNVGANTEPNGLNFKDSFVQGCVNYGFDLWSDSTGTGSVIAIDGGNVGNNDVSIKISGACREVVIGPNPIYNEGNTGVNIWIAGTSASVKPRSVSIKNFRGSGTIGTLANMIKLDFCDDVLIENCVAFNYSDSMVLCNAATNTYKLTFVNPFIDGTTPYIINTPSDNFFSTATDRILGAVIEAKRQGVIVAGNSSGLIEGSVVAYRSGTGLVGTTTTADDIMPAVMMYPSASNTGSRPGIVVTKGITPVNMNAATTIGDTITTSATARQGKTNNSATDPKIILGHAIATTASGGLCTVRIL